MKTKIEQVQLTIDHKLNALTADTQPMTFLRRRTEPRRAPGNGHAGRTTYGRSYSWLKLREVQHEAPAAAWGKITMHGIFYFYHVPRRTQNFGRHAIVSAQVVKVKKKEENHQCHRPRNAELSDKTPPHAPRRRCSMILTPGMGGGALRRLRPKTKTASDCANVITYVCQKRTVKGSTQYIQRARRVT